MKDLEKMKTAEEYFKNRFGSGFNKVTLEAEDKERFVRTEDVIELMEEFTNAKSKALLEEAESEIEIYEVDGMINLSKNQLREIFLSLIPKDI